MSSEPSQQSTENSLSHTEQMLAAEIQDLTSFQQAILTVLRTDGPKYGLRVKRDLEDLYKEEVNHGRLYPNLDTLVEEGYIEKGERDRRTNEYRITSEGREACRAHEKWQAKYRPADAPTVL